VQKRRVVYRMQARTDTAAQAVCYQIRSFLRRLASAATICGMIELSTDGRTVFAVQRHVEHAGAELLGHVRLQLQALDHARFDAAVMVTHRQHTGSALRTEKDVARMLHVDATLGQGLQQVLHAVLFALQFSLRVLLMHSWREGVDRQAFDDLVLAAFAGDGETEHDVLRGCRIRRWKERPW